MAYKGYMLKIGEYIFPNKYIKPSSYSAYVNMQDVEPWTDANGETHRNPVQLKAAKVEFETIPLLTNTQFVEILNNIRSNYYNTAGRMAVVEYYIPEYDDYVTQRSYLADFQPQIYGIFDNVIKYNSIRLAFVGGLAQ